MAHGTSLNSSFLYPSPSLSLSPPSSISSPSPSLSPPFSPPLSPSSPPLSLSSPPLSPPLLSPSSSSPPLSPPPVPPSTAHYSSSLEFLSVIVERDEGKRCDLMMSAECRICQEDDKIASLEAPCNCSGSLKYAHRKCVQRWCNEKGDTICEICRQSYHGYTIPPQLVQPEDSIAIEFSEEWNMSGPHPLEFRHPRILAMAAAQHHFLEAASDYDDFAEANSRGASLCRSVILILMAMLLLRHALAMVASTEDQDSTMFLTLFLLRAAGFLLPCFIMVHAMNMLQRRQQQQEVAMAATEVARLLQAGQARGVQLTLSSGLSSTGHV